MKETSDAATLALEHLALARQAEDATRWEDAVRHYEDCLASISDSGGHLQLDEAALLTSLGRSYWYLAEARTAWRTLRRAITLCRGRGDGEGMARATIQALQIWGPPERQAAMMQEALDALGPDGNPYLRARLLLRQRWVAPDFEARLAEALKLAEQHGFEDILMARTEREGFDAMESGNVDDALPRIEEAHATYARLRAYEPAAGVLRGAGYGVLQQGLLDPGEALAQRAAGYARSVGLRFNEQLALLDVIGVAFARCEFARCEELLDRCPGDLDFRRDLYRMWIMEVRGDIEGALAFMVDPQRGGGAMGAATQTHAAAAGLLFRAGRLEAAREELRAWADIVRQDEFYPGDMPALTECLVGLGDDELVRDVYEAFTKRDASGQPPIVYSTLQGRAVAPVRGAVALRVGALDNAERTYREGLEWCERERCPIDAARCMRGLASVLERRGGDRTEAGAMRQRAQALLAVHGVTL